MADAMPTSTSPRPQLKQTTSAYIRTWSLWRWLGILCTGTALVAALVHFPVTRDPLVALLGRIQWDNAPVTLSIVTLSLLVESAKHYVQGFAEWLEASSLFFTPSRSECATLFAQRGARYTNKWRLPDSRLLRALLFAVRIVLGNVGHSGWGHFANNSTQLLLLGAAVEGAFGSEEVLVMVGWMSLASVATQWTFGAANVAAQGASGIVFMYYLLSAQINRTVGKVPLTLLLQMAIYLPKELDPILNPRPGNTVSHLGHFTGAVVGALLGFLHTAAAAPSAPAPAGAQELLRQLACSLWEGRW